MNFVKIAIFCLALSQFSNSRAQEPAVILFNETSVQASSEPVSIYQMINGWEGKFYGGDFAFLDGRIYTGFGYDDFALSYEKRWYAGFKFNEETARYYYNVENHIKTDNNYPLNLRLKMLEAEGLSVAKEFRLGNLSIKPTGHWYQSGRYQFGTVRGNVRDQNGLSASAEVDYFYHQDKLLQDPNSGTDGYGGALDLALRYDGLDWQLDMRVQDLWNYWYFPEAGHTYGCLNLQGNAQPVCDSLNTENYSRPTSADFRLPMTVQTSAQYRPWLMQLSLYRHSRYQRLSLQKDWSSPLGLWGASLHSTKQVGVHWRSYWHHLSLMSDQYRYQSVRHLELQLGFSWAF